MTKTGFRIACLVGTIGLLSSALTPALATEQVYHPISPALGGNPTNGPFLLSTAQAQGEGVNSGNNGPTINFPNLTPTTPTTAAAVEPVAARQAPPEVQPTQLFRNNSSGEPAWNNSGMPVP